MKLKLKKLPLNSAHLLYNLTPNKIYEIEPVKLTGKVINHWLIDDKGKKLLLSAKARKEFFESV